MPAAKWPAMLKNICFILVAVTSAVACGGSADTVSETCERLDDCNVLGTSINDCREELELALDQATPSVQADWETLMNDCLEFEGCSTFLSCAGIGSSADGENPDDTHAPSPSEDGGEGPTTPGR